MGTVLVVDDNRDNLEVLESLLNASGYGTLTAQDGEEALVAFGRIRPDLVLLDVEMPLLNGIEVCRRLKQDSRSRLTPVVLVTGLSAAEDRIRGIEAGADDFLNKPFDRIELLARVRSLISLKEYTDELEHAETVLFALARSIEGKDPYTEGHCERLSRYAVRLGERLGLPPDHITALRRAGIVHDIGKVAVSEAILLKPGPLTQEEWEIMRRHPEDGERICSPLKSFRLVLPAIRHHHEKLDGSGYPDGLTGENIPLLARVIETVDVFDALSTNRPYRPALSPEESFAVMRKEAQRGWWDISLVEEFQAIILNRP